MGKLTAKQVIAYSKADPKKYSDGEGLYFCVRKQGSPYWMIRYTTAKGRREATLGQFPLMSLADARIAAAYFRKEVRDGIDPLLEKQKIELPDIETVDQLFHDWYRTDLSRRLKHPKIPYRVYTKDISPVIGIKCIAEVTARDVREVLERIRESNRPTIANDTLIALQTAAPRTIDKPASTFLGSPPLSIEKREKALGDLSLTYRPSTCRKCCRCSFEVFGYLLYTLYGALFATTSLFAIDLCYGIYGERNVGVFVVTLPVVQLAMGGALCLLIIVSKWTIMCGRFKAGTYPLFSFYVWRTALVERLEENLAEPILLNMLDGTCWKVFYCSAQKRR